MVDFYAFIDAGRRFQRYEGNLPLPSLSCPESCINQDFFDL